MLSEWLIDQLTDSLADWQTGWLTDLFTNRLADLLSGSIT